MTPTESYANDSEITAPQRLSKHDGQTVIALDPLTERAGEIQTVQLRRSANPVNTVAYGSVIDLQALLADASAFDSTQAQLDAAEAKFRESEQSLHRARTLHEDDQNVSRAQLQSSESAFEVDQSNLRAARMQFKLAHARLLQAWGSVLSQSIRQHDVRFNRLTEVQDVLLLVTLPVGAQWAMPVAGAVALAEHGRTVPLTFISLALRSDPKIQGIGYFFTAPADAGLLPGMTITVSAASADATQTMVIPSSAVVWAQGRPWAYERLGANRFRRRAIDPVAQTSSGDYLVREQSGHDEVVSRGAQTLLSEEFRAQADVDD
jgi:hypothetical protein